MKRSYNRSAWFYDRLSRLVFGRAQVNAQIWQLRFVPPACKVLIVGGGTGWILEELALVHKSGLQITYVELSENMNKLARQRNPGQNQVTFISADIIDFKGNDFDIIITPFLFDNFSQPTADMVFHHLHTMLNSGGYWLYTDFQLTGRWWQKPLLTIMYTFFKIIGDMQVSRLPHVASLFQKHNYLLTASKSFYGQFITSKAYQKG